MIAPVTVIPHTRTECYQVMGTRTGRAHSYEFSCPACGRTGRFNTNYLGSYNTVFCDGQRFERAPKGIARPRLRRWPPGQEPPK